ncbi:MAG: efflux RND transporter periplasmic adaptor subunit [Phycisphaerae bacterium]|nr:efflux RND transporter periplasmic adaptor subunit [Phycisphaerae bacterium]
MGDFILRLKKQHLGLLGTVLLVGVVGGAVGMRYWMGREAGHSSHAHRSTVESVPRDQHDDDGHEDNKPNDQHDADEHGDAHDRGAHGGHQEGVVRLSPEAMKSYGIEVAVAGPGKLERTITLPGEVRLNADRVAHIVPRVSGMVREVRKNLGDAVTAGEVIAILDSRELADAKAADLAAASRHELAKANVERIEKLFEKKIAPEEELLKARQTLAETDIDHRTAEAKLHALGLTQEQVENLHKERDTDYSRYEIKAPFAGTVIEKHITLGEVVNPETSCFVLADLSDVWIDVTVYPQDVPHVVSGRPVIVSAAGMNAHRGEIAYVSPKVDEGTRTGMARVVLPNADGHWRPGMFVRADLVVSAEDARVVVPDSAIQTIENQPVVFVEEHERFEMRPVVVGRKSGTHCEVVSGLNPGERYAATGTFILKAELGKAEAEHEH